MASLSGSIAATGSSIDLSNPAQTDWIQFPQSATSVNKKSGGGSLFDLPGLIAGAAFVGYSNDPVPLGWSDGAPTASASNSFEGIYAAGPSFTSQTGQGCSISLVADTTPRTLTVYMAAYACQVQLVATLSDGSAAPVTLLTDSGNNGYLPYNATFAYAAASAGQKITIAMTMVGGVGIFSNVSLRGASVLASAAPIVGVGASTQAANTSSGAGTPVAAGAAASAQAANVGSGVGTPIITGSASSTQQPNISTGSSAAPRAGPVDPATAPVYAENRFIAVAHESRVAYLGGENRIVKVAR